MWTYIKKLGKLINLKCKTMSDFRWYKNIYFSKLYQLSDPNQEFWKENFISGLPPLFAEKVSNRLRNERDGSINYKQLDMEKIAQKVQLVGAELCNNLKIRDQLKKQKLFRKKELGNFCYQFGFQLDQPYKKNLKNQKNIRRSILDGQEHESSSRKILDR